MDVGSLVVQISTGSIAALAGATVVANAFPGIPEELFILVMGSVVGEGTIPFWVAFLVLFTMLSLMDQVLYWLVRSGRGFIRRMIGAIQKRIFGDSFEGRIDFIERHINTIVVASRFVFQIRFLGPFLAATVKMPWRRFTTLNMIALGVYIPLMLWIGKYFGNRIQNIISGVQAVSNSVRFGVIALLVVLILYLVHKGFLKWLRNAKDRAWCERWGIKHVDDTENK
jgi:membrane protein DedA with SNARE-associated domain